VTAPEAADLPDVRRTALQLMKWLRAQGLTDATTTGDLFAQYQQARPKHPKGSLPAVVTEAFLHAFMAAEALNIAPMIRALAEVNELRAGSAKLLKTCTEIDARLAKLQVRRAGPTFAASANNVVGVVELTAAKIEAAPGVRGAPMPTTKAKWKTFVGEAMNAFVNAGMPLDEAISLFPQRGSVEAIKVRFQRQRSRLAAREGVQGKASKKKST
jgi:hypothetical protein